MAQNPAGRRRSDGSIDVAYYSRRAARWRRRVMRLAAKRAMRAIVDGALWLMIRSAGRRLKSNERDGYQLQRSLKSD